MFNYDINMTYDTAVTNGRVHRRKRGFKRNAFNFIEEIEKEFKTLTFFSQ